jgi:hypothetical protein
MRVAATKAAMAKAKVRAMEIAIDGMLESGPIEFGSSAQRTEAIP